MRYIDLEMYKWRWHHDIYIHTRPKPPYISWRQYWMEDGAFVSVMPRQSGKTQMLLTLATMFEERGEGYWAVCPNTRMKEALARRGLNIRQASSATLFRGNAHPLSGLDFSRTNLLVDEFTHISKKNHLIHILEFPWKTVTMVGSLSL